MAAQNVIPPLFRCPISLELMTDPVTLWTGITYERASIEKWIADGNLTCPATMQSMASTELVPNYTLKRLIESYRSSLRPEEQQKKRPIDKLQQLDRRVVQRIRGLSGPLLAEELRRFRFSLKENSSSRNLRPDLRDELMSSLMLVLEESGCNLEASQEAIGILCLLPLSPKHADHRLLQAICTIVAPSSNSSAESKAWAASIVEKLCSEDWELKSQLGSNQAVLHGLTHMISDKKSAKSSLAALHSLLAIRRNRGKLVAAGAVHRIIELLPELENRGCTELGLCVLELLCRTAEGRAAFAGHELGMFAITKKMFRVSCCATELAVAIMWSLCTYSPDEAVRRSAVEASAFERLLLLLHVDCSPVTKQKVCELLKLLRQVYSEEPCIIASPDQALQSPVVPIYPRC